MTQSAAKTTAPLPVRAADFTASLGVNTHLDQAGYSASAIVADMAYLGLGAVRNQEITAKTTKAQLADYGKLAAAGLKFDWLTGGKDVSTTAALKANLAALDAFLTAHPGSVAAIEGANEVNNFPITFNGLTGTAAAVAYQQALYTAVKADPLTASIPVVNFTDNPATAGAADAANAHPYPSGGAEALARLTAVSSRMQALMPGKALYLTEAGYTSLPGASGGEGVDPATQAKLTLNMIMDAEKMGVSATYLYDLVDDGADPAGAVAADHFGLFTATGQAKPVAVAIHDLTSILADAGAAARSFTPKALNFTIAGLPASGSSLVIETSAGVYDIVVWAEPTIWNASAHAEVAAPSTPVTLAFAQAFAQVSVFDPLESANAIKTGRSVGAVTIGVTDHPLIVQVSTMVQAMATFGASKDSVSFAGAQPAAASTPSAPTLASGH